jgi:gamma-glutamyltranspeptidase/glutathione hydrolase
MVAAANPLAVEAGAACCAPGGGSAADAMVAVQAVLGLVEPQSSGLGGGAFLVWYDAETGEVTTLDGRETAPLAATPQLFQDAEGEPLGFFDAVVGGRSVGTPGTPALMQAAHAAGAGALGPACSTARSTLAEGALPSRRAWPRSSPAMPSGCRASGDRGLFPARRQPHRGGRPAAEPRLCRDVARHGRRGARRVLHRAHRGGHRRHGAQRAGQPGLLSLVDLALYG